MRYHGNKGNNHQVIKLLIVKQIPLAAPHGIYREQRGEYPYWCYGVRGHNVARFWDEFHLGLDSGPTHVKKIYFQNCKLHMTIQKDRECEMRVS